VLRFWVLVLGSGFGAAIGLGAQTRGDHRVLSCDGPLSPGMTPKSLAAAFGAANVTTADVHLGEGFFEKGTVLFSASPEDRVEILWTDEELQRDARMVVIRGDKSRWRTVDGLTVGVSLRMIERMNRRPFRLLGFGWDYGGTVMDWSKGLLDNAADGPCTIRARFAPVQNDLGQYVNGTEKYVSQVGGEREFSSGHPAMQALNPVIYEIFIQYR
jgi:hypothetical protein